MPDCKTPLVSVVMPARNTSRYIRMALESILANPEFPLEVIVVDDHSDDDTATAARQVGDGRVRVVTTQGSGVADALNTGFAHATGQVYMRCDSDDRYLPGRVEAQWSWLRDHPEYDAVAGAYCSITESGRLVAQFHIGMPSREITADLQSGVVPVSMCTVAFRRRLWEEIGGARGYFVTGSDIDILLRMAEKGRLWFENAPVYEARIRDTSITHARPRRAVAFYDSIAREFQRQRQTSGQDDLDRGCPPEPPRGDDGGRLSVRRQTAGQLTGESWRLYEQRDYWNALGSMLRAWWHAPLSMQQWRGCGALLAKLVCRGLRWTCCRSGLCL